jgi:pimeloyl-ACP methyl ester carboxylesterase
VTVPLDHSGGVRGDLPIAFARFPAQASSQGTVVFLAGGPGQAGIPAASSLLDGPLDDVRRSFDVIVIDQRGTGLSAPLRCSTAPEGALRVADDATAADVAAAVATCARELGERRRFFSTYETVLDLDDVRRGLGLERIVPLGVSYGGQVAGEYARRFPARTQALVLDSTSPVEGLDAMGTLPQLALPRVLREICFPPGCRRLIGDPPRVLGGALAQARRAPLRGTFALPSGRRRAASVAVADLYALVMASDLDPLTRVELPAALEAAARRDAAPVLRLARRLLSGSSESSGVNDVRFLATACTEGTLPWTPDSNPATRPALLERTLERTADRYGPFPVAAVLAQLPATQCLGWPATPRGPWPPAVAPAPDVPVLLLAGREDLRTPLENQRRSAAQFPRPQVLSVPHTGHSVLASDVSGCAERAVERFLAGAAVRRCPPRPRLLETGFPLLRTLRSVPLPRGGGVPSRVARTLTAVDLTLRDAERQLLGIATGSSGAAGVERETIRIGGLRGGRIEIMASGRVRLVRLEVVSGVRVTGTVGARGGVLRVTGIGARGALRFRRSGRLVGVLDGVAVRYRPRSLGG